MIKTNYIAVLKMPQLAIDMFLKDAKEIRIVKGIAISRSWLEFQGQEVKLAKIADILYVSAIGDYMISEWLTNIQPYE